MVDKREIILNAIEDSVSDLLYYDRKEDEDLRVGEIEEAVHTGVVNGREIVELFANKFMQGVERWTRPITPEDKD